MKKEFFFFFFLLVFLFLENNLLFPFLFPSNLVLLYIFFSSLFLERNLSFFMAIVGGLFLDIFSEKFFGFYLLLSLFIVFLNTHLVKRYVKI